MTPEEIIKTLNLRPHPEGGWYAETWRSDVEAGNRATGTAIYFLLEEDQRSHWHKVDAAEIWHHYTGAPIELSIDKTSHILGPDLASGQRPQIMVPAHAWQAARPLGGWSLVGCTVSPGFQFEGFELAPADWSP